MSNNKVGGGDDNKNSRRPNSTLGEFSITPFSKDEEAAKARVQEVREKMTIDKIGEQVKRPNTTLGEFSVKPINKDPAFLKGIEEGEELKQKLNKINEIRQELDKITVDNLSNEIKTGENISKEMYSLGKTPEELRELFDSCESGSKVELIIVVNILNNPKTTPEDLEYYFDNIQEGSDAEYLIAKAIIAHPNLTLEIFDKNYGIAMQKGGLVFDLFEIADEEIQKNKKEGKIDKYLSYVMVQVQNENSLIGLLNRLDKIFFANAKSLMPSETKKILSNCLKSGVVSNDDLIKLEELKLIKTGNMYLDSIIYTCVNKIKENIEKMENTMQGSIIRKDSERGTGIIHGDNGKDYLLHFSHIKDDNKADIFNELILGSKVEFKLVPYNGKPGIGLDPDFTATDIVVKG